MTTQTILFLVAALLAPAGVSSHAGGGSGPPANPRMLVSGDWLEKHLADPGLVILHVSREGPKAYEEGHIPGARFVDWKDVATTRDGIANEIPPFGDLVAWARRMGIAPESRVVVYGDDAGIAAARAWVVLDSMGMGAQAALLDGMWARWKKEGRPVTTRVPEVAPSDAVFVPNPDVAIGLRQMRDFQWSLAHDPKGRIALLDARPAQEFTGETPGEAVPRPGHIPGARSLPWTEHVPSREDPVLLPAAELRAQLEAAGASPGDTVVTYCRTGGQASLTYFLARYLGYEVRLYDGSFVEWSAQPDTPVAGPPPPAATTAEPGK